MDKIFFTSYPAYAVHWLMIIISIIIIFAFTPLLFVNKKASEPFINKLAANMDETTIDCSLIKLDSYLTDLHYPTLVLEVSEVISHLSFDGVSKKDFHFQHDIDFANKHFHYDFNDKPKMVYGVFPNHDLILGNHPDTSLKLFPIDNIIIESTFFNMDYFLVDKIKSQTKNMKDIIPNGKISKKLIDSIIHQVADRYKVDSALVKAIIMAESGYNSKAVSNKGAQGLMQLMPRTAKAMGVKDSFNPVHNINGGVKYFRHLLDRFNDDVKLALAAYNAGARNVKRYRGIPPFKATKYYIKRVFEYYEDYRQQDEGEQKNT